MFSKDKKSGSSSTNGIESTSPNIINSGTTITGEINSTGDFRIDGHLKGNITTKGRLVVGTTGFIDGNINCKNSDILGKVEGNIVVEELLSLKATAKFTGEIITGKLHVEPGAVFNGTCKMADGTTANVKETAKQQGK